MSAGALVGTFAVGVAAGVLSGMFGVGGAVLTTPGIRALGATPIEAVGSTVPPILPGAISGTWRYSRSGLVNWRVGLVCGAAGTVLAVAGAWVSDVIDGHVLMVLTAALLLYTGVSTFIRARREAPGGSPVEPVDADGPEADVETGPTLAAGDDPEVLAAAAAHAHPLGHLGLVGALSGLTAGLLGVGGGVVMMPVFTQILKIPMKVAVASSLVAVAIFSVPALVTHAALGHINWTYSLLLVAGTIPGAQIGSKITIGTADRTVRLLFGVFLTVLAVVYGAAELIALGS
jgi:uncharacterized membrane protein YfcA